ncbi:NAD(P)-dependent alcohol dehydrogenase [Streptosporangiaceae bacterium NEAU-GS5]|nr:NAD(P)-dependent alcohol dehydrogenase [Streptosporangiaceae bacterium NEAU-GS5]
MRAYVLHSYGSPDDLRLADIAKPEPGNGEALVRVRATSLQPFDWHLLRGEPYLARLMGDGPGLRKPKITILGADIAGVVEAVGPGVTKLRPGDEVYAMPLGGGFGEYVCVPENVPAPKPRNLSFEQAAAVPLAAITALLAVREVGQVAAGQKVLVNGASGGVGTFAVQLAKAYGAHVTAVCSGRNADLVRSLGADEVIDYAKQDFTRSGRSYDVLIDIAGSRPGAACRRVLKRKGIHVLVGGPAGRWFQPAGRMAALFATAPFVSQKVALANVVRDGSSEHLTTLTEFIEAGKVTPVIDSDHAFEDLPAALEYQEKGHAAGKVVVSI